MAILDMEANLGDVCISHIADGGYDKATSMPSPHNKNAAVGYGEDDTSKAIW